MESLLTIAGDLGGALVEFSRLFIPPLVIVSAIALICYVVMRRSGIAIRALYLPLIFAACLIGVVPGIIAGYSQQAIAGTFLTATIGIVSALLSYAFAKDGSEEWRPAIPFAMIAALVGALAGFSAGNVQRFDWLEYDQLVADRRSNHDNIDVPVEKARQLHNLEVWGKANPHPISKKELAAVNDGKDAAVPK